MILETTPGLTDRIGLFGGLFNPPHLGHLVLAREAAWQLQLDRVVFMPAGVPPHRRTPQLDPSLRLDLVRRVTDPVDGFSVSDFELRKDSPAYTSDTLEALRAEHGGAIVLLLGGDSAATLQQWHEPQTVVELAELGIVERDEIRAEQIAAIVHAVSPAARAHFLSMPQIGVSSSIIRERIRSGQPIRWLVPDGVAELIESHRLYAS